MNARRPISRNDWRAIHGMIFFTLAATAGFFPLLRPWPLALLAPLAAYALVVGVVPALRATFPAWRFGRPSGVTLLATLVLAAISCAVLVVYDVRMRPDVREYATFLQVSALGGVVVAGWLFSLLNPLLEEMIFRGILYEAVDSQTGRRMAIVLTAALFGIAHLHGYPPGRSGAALAVAYGLCLGWLRAASGGLGLPIVAHIAADATIYVLIAKTGVFRA